MAGVRARETLDRVLTVAAFDQWVTLVFIDDGVYQLVAPGGRDRQGASAWRSMLGVLDLYDIREVYVDEQSLRARGLHVADLVVAAEVVARSGIRQRLAEPPALVFVC